MSVGASVTSAGDMSEANKRDRSHGYSSQDDTGTCKVCARVTKDQQGSGICTVTLSWDVVGTVPPETHSELIPQAQKIEFESCK